MTTVHYVFGIIATLITGMNAAAPSLPPAWQLGIHVGTAVLTPVLTFLGVTSASALQSAAAAAPAVKS
jgi:hypothetical protein